MKSKSPFLSKSPLKSMMAGDLGSRYLSGELEAPELNIGNDFDFLSNPTATGTPRPGEGNLPLMPPSNNTLPGSVSNNSASNILGRDVNNTSGDTSAADLQRLASNQQRLNQGGLRGQPGDEGYASQANADIYNDVVDPSSEGMGQVIVSGGTPSDNALIEAGEAMGPVTTTNSGERVGRVGSQSGMTGFLDEGGNAIQITELTDQMQDDSWINDTGAVTLPSDADGDMTRGDADLSEVIQTSNVQSAVELGGAGGAVPVDPGVANANIPKSMGGECNTNYTGDGKLYNNLNGLT